MHLAWFAGQRPQPQLTRGAGKAGLYFLLYIGLVPEPAHILSLMVTRFPLQRINKMIWVVLINKCY
jgi:hypothetical protein